MTVPVCTIIEAAEMASLGSTLLQLWLLTVFALLVAVVDWSEWGWRIRRWLRRRRIQRIRAARLALEPCAYCSPPTSLHAQDMCAKCYSQLLGENR